MVWEDHNPEMNQSPLTASADNSSDNGTSKRYSPLELEQRWQKTWKEIGVNATQDTSSSPSFYALSMFPYPSGNLHMGHVRNYVITDVIARVQRMRGYAVLHPMGWDAFGLPAENAAIERNIDPGEWTHKNIDQMRSQLDRLGLSIDWERELATCNSNYYRWTQWLFLELFDGGLAYRKNATVNWDPVDQTVLANEQVDEDGRSWRSGAIVEQRTLYQWFLGITEYAESLLNDLNQLTGWPERVRTMQANWIGRSEGAIIKFQVKDIEDTFIEVFTTRADTIAGANYLVLAPEHDLINTLTTNPQKDNVERFKHQISQLSRIERTNEGTPKNGIPLGTFAVNPLTGFKMPIWIADYVLADYATGAVMGVPAHDQRDIEFALKYNLEITQVIDGKGISEQIASGKAWTKSGTLINSNNFNGINSYEAKKMIIDFGIKNGWARNKINYRLRDWLISRQRYWGCPIPIIHCNICGVVPVPRQDLPVELPSINALTGKSGSPLNQQQDWINVSCPSCGSNARRETDTMDTFMCSSWYFLRFADPHNNKNPFNKETISKWLPVKQYVGGIEHAILHLLYSRFITKALYDRNLININEPFERLLTQGMVQGITYRNPRTRKYISLQDIEEPDDPYDPNTAEKLEIIYEKMSKSKYNGVDPSKVIDRYGADTARMFILFKAPPDKDLEWDESDVEGQSRFLQRLWRLVDKASASVNSLGNQLLPDNLTPQEKNIRRSVHLAVQAVTDDFNGEIRLNTAISELMKLSNALGSIEYSNLRAGIIDEAFSILIRLLAPFAPHLAEELWSILGGEQSVHQQIWPKLDTSALSQDYIKLIIQVNGKMRGSIEVPNNIDIENVRKLALDSDIAKKWLDGVIPSRVIVVPGKLVNLVP